MATVFRFFSRGLPAAFTGGFFYDVYRTTFLNTLHLYLWLFLFGLPLFLSLVFGRSSVAAEVIYPCVVFLLFVFLKFINHYFHALFDSKKIAEASGNHRQTLNMLTFWRSMSRHRDADDDIDVAEEMENAPQNNDDDGEPPTINVNQERQEQNVEVQHGSAATPMNQSPARVSTRLDASGVERMLAASANDADRSKATSVLPHYPFPSVFASAVPTKWSPTDTSTCTVSIDGRTVAVDHDQPVIVPGDNFVPSSGLGFYFEVTIEDSGNSNKIAIGLYPTAFPLEGMPGVHNGSYGYHGDTGFKFSAENEQAGVEYGPTFKNSDVIGCGFNRRNHTVFFTKNGEHLGTAFMSVVGRFYPVVGIHSAGARVGVNFGHEPFQFDVKAFFDTQTTEIPQVDGPMDGVPVEGGTMFSFVDENGVTQHYVIPVENSDAPDVLQSSPAPENNLSRHSSCSSSSSDPPQDLSSDSHPRTQTETSAAHQPPPAAANEDNIRDFYRNQIDTTDNSTVVSIFGKRWVVPFDRQRLESFMDRNYRKREILFSIILATVVAWLAWRLLKFYQDIPLFFMWVAVASSHFSLLKSAQPDAHSPQPWSPSTGYTRSTYFVLFGALIYLFDYLGNLEPASVPLYGIAFNVRYLFFGVKDFFFVLIPLFPLLFAFGWLPQFDTFIIYACEQVHIHLFGGSGLTGIVGAIIQLGQDLLVLGGLIGIGYYSVAEQSFGDDYISGIYSGFFVALSYLLSRSPSNPRFIFAIGEDFISLLTKLPTTFSKDGLTGQWRGNDSGQALINFERNLEGVVPLQRFVIDLGIAFLIFAIVTGIQLADGLAYANPYLNYILSAIIIIHGFVLYYILPQLRKPQPWNFFYRPLLGGTSDDGWGDSNASTKISWYERCNAWMRRVEKILYILLIISTVSEAFQEYESRLSIGFTLVWVSVACIKVTREMFSDASRLWVALAISLLLFNIDLENRSEPFLINLFIISIVYHKLEELYSKMGFIFIYSTPLSWGAGSHVILQPLGIPNVTFTIFQLFVSTILSSPMYPLIGSPLFFASYPRPVKYWERDYKTTRQDSDEQRLSQSLGIDGGGALQYDSNNLNSIFYEHLVVALRRALPDAIRHGTVGSLTTGDVLLIMNDNGSRKLTAMVHIIEAANGVCTFQLRGIEFRGTYCQEREVEAITEALEPEGIRGIISPMKMLQYRLQTWEVINTCLALKTYDVTENRFSTMLSLYEQRSEMLKYYIQSSFYFLIRRPELYDWINTTFREPISRIKMQYADCDPLFNEKLDPDYDHTLAGVSFASFLSVHRDWINKCITERATADEKELTDDEKERIRALCFITSLLVRRTMSLEDGTHSGMLPEMFLERLHSLFNGDLRITARNDEWVLTDPSLLDSVKAGLRIALRVFREHFTMPDMFADPEMLWDAVQEFETDVVICPETSREWREAVLNEAQQLFTMRKLTDDENRGTFFMIMLDKRPLNFSVIKMNKESVRGLWAGQQQELVYFQNDNMERGSIQQMKIVLRNIINQSCDLPVGYPVFVSPLTTSYFGL